jgi:hypothetical protein
MYNKDISMRYDPEIKGIVANVIGQLDESD